MRSPFAAGVAGILAEPGAAIVASLPERGLDATRAALAERAAAPVLFVHAGPRPSGLAPRADADTLQLVAVEGRGGR